MDIPICIYIRSYIHKHVQACTHREIHAHRCTQYTLTHTCTSAHTDTLSSQKSLWQRLPEPSWRFRLPSSQSKGGWGEPTSCWGGANTYPSQGLPSLLQYNTAPTLYPGGGLVEVTLQLPHLTPPQPTPTPTAWVLLSFRQRSSSG